MSEPDDEPRIAVLSAALADQIAAGEVVERPASIVKELVDNAVDAGASRVELELEGGGRDGIRVIDDGGGIHREDLPLALTRHATSKLDDPGQLVEIATLGFRGEALASIAAVARIDLRSRQRGASVGHRARAVPGQALSLEPIGMPEGTQVAIESLFANVPARRKFLRSEATEVGHCVDALIRIALVHPEVQFKLRHGRRTLLELPAGDRASRVIALLERRGGSGPFVHVCGERRGTSIEGWFAPPSGCSRQRNASFVVVRRRVVRERTLAAMIRSVYGDSLSKGSHPVACLFVEPPRGTVDVNVHPQKSEVRFSSAQEVFAGVRELLDEGTASAPWRADPHAGSDSAAGEDAERSAWAAGTTDESGEGGAHSALAGWSRRGILSGASPLSVGGGGTGAGASGRSEGGYRLGTRASASGYGEYKAGLRGEVDRLRARYDLGRAPSAGRGEGAGKPPRPLPGPSLPMPLGFDADPPFEARESSPRREPEPEPVGAWPTYLTCVGGEGRPVGLFEFEGELVAVDLRRLRAHLVRRRLIQELADVAEGERVPAQALIEPAVVRRRGHERELLLRSREALAEVGVELDDFGDDAVVVRAVPAALRKLLEPAQIAAFLSRLTPWLNLRERSESRDTGGFVDAVTAMSLDAEGELGLSKESGTGSGSGPGTGRADVSPRYARRWLAEALREHGGDLASIPGVRRWSSAELTESST